MARSKETVQVLPKTWTEITNADATGVFTWSVTHGEETWFMGMPTSTAPTNAPPDEGDAGLPYQRGEGESIVISDFWDSAVRLFAYSVQGSKVYANG